MCFQNTFLAPVCGSSSLCDMYLYSNIGQHSVICFPRMYRFTTGRDPTLQCSWVHKRCISVIGVSRNIQMYSQSRFMVSWRLAIGLVYLTRVALNGHALLITHCRLFSKWLLDSYWFPRYASVWTGWVGRILLTSVYNMRHYVDRHYYCMSFRSSDYICTTDKTLQSSSSILIIRFRFENEVKSLQTKRLKSFPMFYLSGN